MGELFAALLRMTQEAVDHLDEWTDEQWAAFMEERTQLVIRIRRLDAELPEGDASRGQYRQETLQLAKWDELIVGKFNAIREEASGHLSKIGDFRKQKDAYDDAEPFIEAYFVDQKW